MERRRNLLALESPTVYLVSCLETKPVSSSDEKTIIGTDKHSLLAENHKRKPLGSNTRVDNTHMYRTLREVRQSRLQDERAHGNVMTFNSMRDINNLRFGSVLRMTAFISAT